MAKKKKYDVPEEKAKRMSAKDVLREIRKGRTVSGYSDYLDEHFGVEMVKDVPLREIEKLERRKGSLWTEGTISTRRGGGLADTARELFGKGAQKPPNGRSSWW